jgi:predicted phage terminase large subunit-like protein
VITPADAATELLARRKARGHFTDYCRYRLPEDMTLATHHELLTEALNEVETGDCDRLLVMMPPGSAKSTYGSVYFPEYFAGRNPQLSIIAASHTAELAERFGRRVRNGVDDVEFKALFPTVSLAADSTAAGRWGTNHGGEYTAVGVGGSVTGRRGDLIVVDDPVRSREDADSERVREKTWEWWTNDLLTRLKPGGRIVVIMTRWHEDDLAGRLLEREPQRWKVIKLPMIAGENDPLGREPGDRLWQEWFTDAMVQQAQADPRSWISLYQQEPRPAEGAEFKRAWISRFNNAPKKMNKVILVDPAGDPSNKSGVKRKKSDRTVMWVVGLGSDGNAYLVDGIIDRLSLTQRADKLFALHKKHKPMQVRYERYGMMGDIAHIKNEMEHRQYRFKVIEVAGAVEKNARIRRLIPWFEGGRMWFPQAMNYTDVQGVDHELIQEFIDVEYATFPVGRYDDGMDCLARLEEPSLSLPWPDDEDEWEIPEQAQAAWAALDNHVGY